MRASGLAIAALFVLSGLLSLAGSYPAPQSADLYTVQPRELDRSILSRGTLFARHQTDVECGVYNLDPSLGGTVVLWIAANGTQVEAGDLVARLDSADVRDRLDLYQMRLPYFESLQQKAQARLENRKLQNTTNLAEAQQRLELAEMALRSYGDPKQGSYKISLDESQGKLHQALAAYQLQEERLEAVEALHRLGYRSRSDLERAQLKAGETESQLVLAVANRKRLQTIDYPAERLRLEQAVQRAEQQVKRVRADNQTQLITCQSICFEADSRVQRWRELAAQYAQQVSNFEVRAPHAGTVVHVPDRGEPVQAGSAVRWKQTLLRIADLRQLSVSLLVHEGEFQQVEVGQIAAVDVPALGKRLEGTVHSIGAMPWQQRAKPGVIEYEVVLDVEHPPGIRLLPGMTAIVEIQVARRRTLAVPHRAVQQDEHGQSYVRLPTASGTRWQPVRIGLATDRWVEILEGLSRGDLVLLD